MTYNTISLESIAEVCQQMFRPYAVADQAGVPEVAVQMLSPLMSGSEGPVGIQEPLERYGNKPRKNGGGL